MNRPWMKFYPADWRAEPRLRMCSLAARGLWIDLISYMHEGEPYGYLTINGVVPGIDDMAALVSRPVKEVQKAFDELEAKNVFSVDEGSGALYSRRMVRDHDKSEEGREQVAKRWANTTPIRSPNRSEENGLLLRSQIPEARIQKEKKEDIRAVAKATRPVRDEVFEEFWKAYPKREGANPKTPARKSFDAALKSGVDPPAIIAGARAYAADPSTKIGTSYVAQAVTWLKQKRWEDHVSGTTETALDELERHRRECLRRSENLETEVRGHTGMGENGSGDSEKLRSSNGMVRGESETMGRQLAVSVARAGHQIDGG